MEEIVEEIDDLLVKNQEGEGTHFIVQGGYFDAISGPDEFTYTSFEKALLLGKLIQQKNKNHVVQQNMLINDLGINCSQGSCQTSFLRDDACYIQHTIDAFQAKASQSGTSLTVTTERYARNWGFRRIKKIVKMDNRHLIYPFLYTEPKADYIQWKLRSHLGSDIVLFESHITRWIAKCPIIMGAYYALHLAQVAAQKKSSTSMATIIVDFCVFNDKNKVSRGAETALRIFQRESMRQDIILPIFCDSSCKTMLPYPIFSMDLK